MSADSLVVLPTVALDSLADLEHRPQQNRHWARHRLRRRRRRAPVCLCVCAKAIRRTCKDLIPSFQYPSIDLDERTSLGAGPSPTSPPPSAVGNFTSSGSAPGTGATKAAMPCRQTDMQTDRQADRQTGRQATWTSQSGTWSSATVSADTRTVPWWGAGEGLHLGQQLARCLDTLHQLLVCRGA